MARTDHEAVLRELRAYIAAKTQHGRDQLLPLIADLEAKCVVPESLIERAIRVHGLPLIVQSIPEAEATADPEHLRDGMPVGHGPPMTRGGHDGKQHSSAEVRPRAA